jgi:hypothetical protein
MEDSVICRYLLWAVSHGKTSFTEDCIGGIMVSMLASSVVGRGFKPWSGQTKDYKIGICCFSTKLTVLRAKIGWLGIRIMRPSGATCRPVDCCFSELAL